MPPFRAPNTSEPFNALFSTNLTLIENWGIFKVTQIVRFIILAYVTGLEISSTELLYPGDSSEELKSLLLDGKKRPKRYYYLRVLLSTFSPEQQPSWFHGEKTYDLRRTRARRYSNTELGPGDIPTQL